jgi:hypothetical protein
VTPGRRFSFLVAAALAGAVVMASPAQAQYSDQYLFLKAVKEKDGDKIVELLNTPGSTLVNSRDLTSGETGLHIAVARRDYIEAVRAYNTELRTFPGVIWASTFFRSNKPMAEFTANEDSAKPPQVKF